MHTKSDGLKYLTSLEAFKHLLKAARDKHVYLGDPKVHGPPGLLLINLDDSNSVKEVVSLNLLWELNQKKKHLIQNKDENMKVCQQFSQQGH